MGGGGGGRGVGTGGWVRGIRGGWKRAVESRCVEEWDDEVGRLGVQCGMGM